MFGNGVGTYMIDRPLVITELYAEEVGQKKKGDVGLLLGARVCRISI
jgi:hypothetical protein